MAKLKAPLISLDAHGSIGRSVTFQSSTKRKYARTKPVPADRRSSAQLAHRQRYRDAVDIWNALTLGDKEAWRGVCKGLSPFPCFMRSELSIAPVPPPPTEYTEEQTATNGQVSIKGTNAPTCGVRMTISGREVTKLAFEMKKFGNPTGDVTFTVRKSSDKSLLMSKVWADAATLTGILVWYEVEFAVPLLVNDDVRLLIEHSGYNATNYIQASFQTSDVKPGEWWTRGSVAGPVDMVGWDFTYRYKYFLP